MMPSQENEAAALSRKVIQAFDKIGGFHAGLRPAHAKGILLSGEFTPSAGAAALSRAPHLHRSSTPVSVRFSNFAGVPAIPDNHPQSSPRGCAIRFHLAEHVHTDIIAHSVDAFPARTAEEFLEFLTAAGAGLEGPHPTPIESFLGTHPAALRFVQIPKPVPTSFVKEKFFSVSAYRFVNEKGESQYGRYRIHPDGAAAYLSEEEASGKSADFLFEEIRDRLAKEPAVLRISLQLAAPGDVVNDATVQWPEERPGIEFGTLQIRGIVPENPAEQRHIIFDPIPRVDGIEASDDPLLQPRADVYLMSGRRRRADGPA
jgi:catalase